MKPMKHRADALEMSPMTDGVMEVASLVRSWSISCDPLLNASIESLVFEATQYDSLLNNNVGYRPAISETIKALSKVIGYATQYLSYRDMARIFEIANDKIFGYIPNGMFERLPAGLNLEMPPVSLEENIRRRYVIRNKGITIQNLPTGVFNQVRGERNKEDFMEDLGCIGWIYSTSSTRIHLWFEDDEAFVLARLSF